VIVNDSAGNKLDYYLDRSVTYTRSSCSSRQATVTVVLHNAQPATGVPAYALGHTGNSLLVSLYSTAHSTVTNATLDGKTAFIDAESERGHPVAITEVPLKAGQTRTLIFHVDEPPATGPLLTLEQPLVRPLKMAVDAPNCPSTG
jgi:hypothetical protein